MASQTEIEEFVVKMTAENGKYIQEMHKASKTTEEIAHKCEEAAKRIEHSQEAVKQFGETVEKSLASIGIIIGLKEAFEKYEKAEKNMLSLEAAIKTNGGEVEKVTEDYKKFAQQIQSTTEVGRGQTLQLLRTAESMGVTGEQAKRVTQTAIALAAANNEDAETYIRAVTMYEQGNKHLLQRQLHLHGVRDELELQQKINQKVAVGEATMLALGQTSGAKMKRVWEDLGKVTKEIGEIVAKAMMPVVDWLGKAVKWFNSMDKGTRELIVTVLTFAAALAPAMMIISKLSGGVLILLGYLKPLGTGFLFLSDALTKSVMGMQLSTKEAILLRVALYAALYIGIREIVKEIGGLNSELDNMQARMDKANKARDKFREKEDEKFKEKTTDISRIKEPEKQKEELQKEIDLAQKKLNIDKETLATVTKEVRTRQGSVKGYMAFLGGKFLGEDPFKEENNNINNLALGVERATERLKKLKEMKEAIDKPSPLLIREIEDMIEGYKTEAETIGMTANQKKIYDLERKHASEEMITGIKEWQAYIEELEKANKDLTDVTKKIEGLAESVDKLGKSEKDILITEIKRSAMSEAEKMYAIDKVKKLSEEKEKWEDIASGMEEIAKLNKEARTPLEEYLETVERLDKLMSTGFLDDRAYAKGLEDASKKLDDAGNAAIKTRTEIQKLNAVLKGSAEAKFQISSFLSQASQAKTDSELKRQAQGFGQPINNVNPTKEATVGEDKIVKAIEDIGLSIVGAILKNPTKGDSTSSIVRGIEMYGAAAANLDGIH